jgi:hypothetical protein
VAAARPLRRRLRHPGRGPAAPDPSPPGADHRGEGLEQIYDLETRVTPLLVKMRRRGVRVDLKHLETSSGGRIGEQQKELDKIRELTGVRLSGGREQAGRRWCRPEADRGGDTQDRQGARTASQKDWLKGLKHPVADAINRARKMDKLRGTFVESASASHSVNGRIHATFNQMRKLERTTEGDDDRAHATAGCPAWTRTSSSNRPATRRSASCGGRSTSRTTACSGRRCRLLAAGASPHVPLRLHRGCTGADKIIKRFNEDLNADSHTSSPSWCGATTRQR